MNFYNKDKKCISGKRISSFYILEREVLSVEKSFFEKKIKLCGISFKFHRNKLPNDPSEDFIDNQDNFFSCLKAEKEQFSGNCILWLDVSIGGGTDVYSRNQFNCLKNTTCILRAQYNHVYDCFRLSVPNKVSSYIYSDSSFTEFLSKITYSEICVNNLVGWKDCLSLLRFISLYKKTHPNTKVTFRCHDFYALCPSFNLINCEGQYCHLKYREGCQHCIEKLINFSGENSNRAFLACNGEILEWRKQWNDFFCFTADEIVAFSDSTKSLFLDVYPEIENKIVVIPHDVKKLNKAVVRNHSGVNIAFLGNMNLYSKGSQLIREMIQNNKDTDIHFFIVGSFDNAPKNVVVTGAYRKEELPEIFSKLSIDVVFITSIWPETFSYTTSESISTGVSVVCYDFGAPAERVSNYEKGLVLKEISPVKNLTEIKKFVIDSR